MIRVQVEERFEEHDLVASPRLVDERLQAQVQCLAGPHRHGHLVHRIDDAVHVPRVSPRELPHQGGMSRRPRVLVRRRRRVGRRRGVAGRRRHERLDREAGGRPIGKALSEIRDVHPGFLSLPSETSEFRPHRRAGVRAESTHRPDPRGAAVIVAAAVVVAAVGGEADAVVEAGRPVPDDDGPVGGGGGIIIPLLRHHTTSPFPSTMLPRRRRRPRRYPPARRRRRRRRRRPPSEDLAMAATDGGGGGEAESRDGRSIFGNRMPGAVRRQEEATAAGRDSR